MIYLYQHEQSNFRGKTEIFINLWSEIQFLKKLPLSVDHHVGPSQNNNNNNKSSLESLEPEQRKSGDDALSGIRWSQSNPLPPHRVDLAHREEHGGLLTAASGISSALDGPATVMGNFWARLFCSIIWTGGATIYFWGIYFLFFTADQLSSYQQTLPLDLFMSFIEL